MDSGYISSRMLAALWSSDGKERKREREMGKVLASGANRHSATLG